MAKRENIAIIAIIGIVHRIAIIDIVHRIAIIDIVESITQNSLLSGYSEPRMS